jgi:hypothetical protein
MDDATSRALDRVRATKQSVIQNLGAQHFGDGMPDFEQVRTPAVIELAKQLVALAKAEVIIAETE